MKQELEVEYLATSEKTVPMHEVFLQRLAAHPILCQDHNFSVSLEHSQNVDDSFEHERAFLLDHDMRSHKSVLSNLGTQEVNQLKMSFLKLAELFEPLRKLENRVASDQDLKLSDILRYDSQVAKDLLYRRLRALADYETANKALGKTRTRNQEVCPESHQQLRFQHLKRLSESAKQELTGFRSHRVSYFCKNLTELAELELKHAKEEVQHLMSSSS